MGFGVFVHRADSIYDDSPAERYQFPKQYRGRVENCIGSWIVYYEPTRVTDARGYFAIAEMQSVISDPSAPDMFMALIKPGSYLDFANRVPFSGPDGILEKGVLNAEGKISGRAQSAVRPLSLDDFQRIVTIGLDDSRPPLPRFEEVGSNFQVGEEGAPFVFESRRERANFSVSRIIRDRVFRRVVLEAYDRRCAITGLRLINGGGRAEVAAAHIRPVEASGPDIVNNGLALSGTAHWMFDRGLIGLTDELKILISRQANDQDAIRSLLNPSGIALPPQRGADRPHPRFLSWHRENCFKQ